MNLGVIGAGYVGVTTGICLASINHKIIIYDLDKNKSEKLKTRKMPFYEPGLQDLLEDVISSENLEIVESIDLLVKKTDGCFICVGTPTDEKNSMDLSQITYAITSISKAIMDNKKKNYEIIIRSTVLPLTTRNKVYPIIKNILEETEFGLSMVPEFLREGQALSDFMNQDKIVIGYIDEKSKVFVKRVFEYFKNKSIFIETNPETAEMIKYTNNAFFSTLISFSNEIANICEKVKGIDTYQVMNALVSDKRITTNVDNQKIVPQLSTYLWPGCGFGGSCFPKDVKALTHHAFTIGTKTPLLDAVLEINDERPKKIVDLAEHLLGNLKEKKISILGLTFKPDTDDLRSSPAVEGIKMLQQRGAKISAYDPKVNHEIILAAGISDISIHKSIEDCIKESTLVILFTKWPEFSSLNGDFLSQHMAQPLIIDGRGYLDRNQFQKNTYYKIGYVEL